MKKINILCVLIAFLFVSNNLLAQQYNSAIGLRLGSPTSVSYKQFIGDESLLEFSAGTRGFNSFSGIRAWIFTGSYQIQKPLDLGELDGLDYFYGGGASLLLFTFDGVSSSDFSNAFFGIQGVLGLSYAFDDVPINITLDYSPTLYIGNGLGTIGRGFGYGLGSLGIRYILSR